VDHVFFIFGLKTSEQRLGNEIGVCPACGNSAAQILIKRSTKFSLFFIPLFPVKRPTYHLTCTFCGTSRWADERAIAGR
jgi:hypothetical protein